MGSGYFGEPNLGNERIGGGGTSSRKSKKNNSDKANKQPQRGLGVAQLEKIRLHSQMGACNYHLPNSFHHNNPPPCNLTTHHHHQEDVRLQTGYSSSSSSFSYSTPSSTSYGFPSHQSIVMGLSDLERANLSYGDAVQPAAVCSSTRWSTPAGAINGFLDTQQFTQPSMTRQLLDLQVLDDNDNQQQQQDTIEERRRKDGSDHHLHQHNSESSGHQDLDLELRLSL